MSITPQAPDAAGRAETVLPSISAGDLTWRPLQRGDERALQHLANQVLEGYGVPSRWSEEETVEFIESPWRNVAQNSLFGFDSDGVPRAYGYVFLPPGDTTQVRVLIGGGVHPDRTGEGVGRELLAWLMARGRQAVAETGRDVPAVLRSVVDDDAPPAVHHLLERAGFEARRFYSELARDLTRLDEQPLPEPALSGSLRLAPWSDELDEPARLAHNDAFRDHWGSQPMTAQMWAETSGFAPEWSYVVVDDEPDIDFLLGSPDTDAETAAALRAGQPLVVGYQAAEHYEDSFAARGYTFGYTGILGVRRAYRGRGIAVAALAAGMRAFADAGLQYALLDVDTENPTGAYGLYSSLGYTKVGGHRAYLIEL